MIDLATLCLAEQTSKSRGIAFVVAGSDLGFTMRTLCRVSGRLAVEMAAGGFEKNMMVRDLRWVMSSSTGEKRGLDRWVKMLLYY